MTNFSASEDQQLQLSIQQSLQDLAAQIGRPIAPATARRLYEEAAELLSHLSYEPITLARVAGTLLVYQLQSIEPEELEWLKTQIKSATEIEEIEELIESMSRKSL